ncbi:hypothetical protein R1sor_003277 [Riccia sorocarpa]|uniref:Uncharacterized protein n=1 Tax=Riccia sorocarpa TaxID=122646 RepID=A0ABD3H4J3_9MARC
MEGDRQGSCFLWHFAEIAFQHLEDIGDSGDERRRWVRKVYTGTKIHGLELSKIALGDLYGDQRCLKKQQTYKLLERESIKSALSSGLFAVLLKAAAFYLPHPEVDAKDATHQALAARVETYSKEEREVAQDIKASQRHEAERMVAAKAAKFSKDKGKSVVVDAVLLQMSLLCKNL